MSATEKIRFFFSRNWLKISRFLNFKEKIVVFFLVFLILGSFVFWISNIYLKATKPIPKNGGEYVEGIVGQPLYVNPLLSQSSEADSDLVQLIYSGLFKYDSEGQIVNALADSYEISEDQKTYTVRLRDNLKWHDGEPLTASDVFFTISILQDPAYKSPLRQNWQGVTVSQVDDKTLKFDLSNPYFGFLNNLTVGILPKHIWANITSERFSLTENNLKPVGSGPYKYVGFQKNSSGEILSYNLESFDGFYAGEPYVARLIFNFYPDEEMMLTAYNKKEIKGMETIDPEMIESIKNKKSTEIKELNFPRYFSLFFNKLKSVPLANVDVRKGLSYAVNKKEIVAEVLKNKGVEISSPFLDTMDEFDSNLEKREYDVEKAKQILDQAGWTVGEDGIRKKGEQRLSFKIYTTDWPDLLETAEILSKQWKEIGVEANVEMLSATDLQQNYIRPREYDALLFGQDMNFEPDLYPFWHSSQKQDPGFNLSVFDDKNADELLRDIRQESNKDTRAEKYRELQKLIYEESPAVFLYSPRYLYPVSKNVNGIETKNINSPAWRFTDVNKWYVKTERVKK